jgi:hypothetical protein
MKIYYPAGGYMTARLRKQACVPLLSQKYRPKQPAHKPRRPDNNHFHQKHTLSNKLQAHTATRTPTVNFQLSTFNCSTVPPRQRQPRNQQYQSESEPDSHRRERERGQYDYPRRRKYITA